MPYEDAKFISQLVPTQPQGGESISEGDNHLRLIKEAVKGSFPNISSRVDSTPAELNAVGQTATDVAKLKTDFADLDQTAHGNVASCYYKNGSKLYSFNIGSVGKVPENPDGTRVNFSPALGGSTPDHYAFSVTPVAKDNVGRPILITVSNVTKDYIDFLATEFQDTDGNWAFLEGGTVDFSLLVTDMESGQ